MKNFLSIFLYSFEFLGPSKYFENSKTFKKAKSKIEHN